MLLDEIRRALSSPIDTHTDDTGHKLAAVLILIFGPDPHILMTKKSNTLNVHAGEIAFPGGKYDKKDTDLVETALREAREELNLSVRRDHVIGQLKPVTTLNSGFSIIPLVSVVNRLPRLKDNPEVESILLIPLASFLSTLKDDPDPAHRSINEMYVLQYRDHTVWGASARILKQIIDKLKENHLL